MIKVPASAVARLCGGTLVGPDVELSNMAGIREAGPGDLTFLANPKYAEFLSTTKASCVIVPLDYAPGDALGEKESTAPSYIVSDNPYLAWAKVMAYYAEATAEKPKPGIHPTAVVDPSATVDPSASVGAQTVIESGAKVGAGTAILPLCYVGKRAAIGKDCLLHANATVREECVLGDRCILHCGAVVGSDGFGYAKDGDRYFKIPQIGNVILEDDVELGANTTIDRGAFGPTRIGRGTKIDNLVQVAHNVQIGANTAMAAQTGISGSTRIGDRVVMAGQVGISGHIEIGDDATIMAQTGISKSVPPKSVMFGYPGKPQGLAKRIAAAVSNLPDYVKRINELERKVAELEERLGERSTGQ